jgi:hypothetical protein
MLLNGVPEGSGAASRFFLHERRTAMEFTDAVVHDEPKSERRSG